MGSKKIYLTKEGYEQYLQEIEELKDKLMISSSDKSDSFRAAIGDGWHDNFAFESAKREELAALSQLETKIQNLSNIEIVDSLDDSDLIDVNDVVKVIIKISETKSKEQVIRLVGASTTDPNAEYKEISINSPLGDAIYGKKVGDIVEYKVSDREMSALIEEKINVNELMGKPMVKK